MDNSIYTALSRQVTLFRDLQTTANNIANINTTGYQAERSMFTDYLVDDGNRRDIAFAQDIATYHETRQGSMQTTGNPLDVAINGEGYFRVETGAGERYTRGGSFQRDGQGLLVTVEGYPVLDDAGQRIQLNAEDNEITIGENGLFVVDGEERAAIGMVEFDDRQELIRESSTLFRPPEGVAPRELQNSRMLQGVLEKSNVQAATELIRLTELSRGAGSTAKFIEVMYDLQRKASNALAKDN